MVAPILNEWPENWFEGRSHETKVCLSSFRIQAVVMGDPSVVR